MELLNLTGGTPVLRSELVIDDGSGCSFVLLVSKFY